ncbi:hypothetical protein Tsubulata_029625 [Turnera subulata]|uniref:RING-type domain-containing protein n=1 Tax=Turnera subulata TaxID=218843 RepID=A0A9Q0JBK6_9ROSI|nr:hypothetical protein Tsubulata_029625 [Turnera subulata]
MELQDLPECPVCLQSYDSSTTVPRVITCGHTTCESCLKNLPQRYPQTIRCPACTQLVKFPSPAGPSSFPKNIDLLRLTESSSAGANGTPKPQQQCCDRPKDCDFVLPPLWSDEFYARWSRWVLPEDAVLVDEEVFRDGERKVSLFDVGSLSVVKDGVFKLSYVAKVMSFLWGMTVGEREELGLVLEVGSRKKGRVCEAYGLWGDLGSGHLFLVCERLEGNIGDNLLGCSEDGVSEDKGLVSSGFAIMGMEICEAVISLHLEGLLMGCLGPSCFRLENFGHVSLSLSEVLGMGRMVCKNVTEIGSGGKKIGPEEEGFSVGTFIEKEMFISPEMLLKLFKKEGIEVECGSFRCSVGRSSDVWSIGCILLYFLVGKSFIRELAEGVDHFMSNVSKEDDSGCRGLMDKVSSLLISKFGRDFESLNRVLCKCLNFDPGSRPLLTDVWKCMRELIVSTPYPTMPRLKGAPNEENTRHYLAFGELCMMQRSETTKKDCGAENNGGEIPNVVQGVGVDKDFPAGLMEKKVKFKSLQGHLDCVTGLAIGGGFLFSSSFDKSVHLWSLQDFSHVHTFKGHEHKVMAVAYVDEEQPLCISVDSGGGIFLWSVNTPLVGEPLKKWYEQKDWRYSGIHTMVAPGNGYLYTGSGDRLIKAWSIRDGTMLCTMEGHKSVVSTLAARDGILYSGSWDGTIRLWSLCDHSLLTVLGQDMPGTIVSVQSLAVNQNILIAACENGHIKVWRNDVFMRSTQLHNGAIFAISMEGKWLFSGGWDKIVNVQELSGDEFHVDIRPVGSFPESSVVTTVLCWQGKLFVGYGDRTVKVPSFLVTFFSHTLLDAVIDVSKSLTIFTCDFSVLKSVLMIHMNAYCRSP